MLNDKEKADLDQVAATLAECIPSLLRQLYDGFIREGFTEEQAMRLTEAYLVTNFCSRRVDD